MAEAGADALSAQERLAEALSQRRSAFDGATAAISMLAAQFGLPLQPLDTDGALALEPSLSPVFAHAVFWPQAASVTNPLAVTRAYAARFAALGGVIAHRRRALAASRRTSAGASRPTKGRSMRARSVVALGPWAPDVLDPLGIKLPLEVKRGYHRHSMPQGNAGLSAAGARCRRRLCDRADGAGPAPHHRRRIRRARCAADAGAVRPPDAEGARVVSARRAGRRQALDGQPAVLSGFAAGDRPAPGSRPVARDRPRALGADARPGHRPADRRDDDGRRRRSAIRRRIAAERVSSSASELVASSSAARRRTGRAVAS